MKKVLEEIEFQNEEHEKFMKKELEFQAKLTFRSWVCTIVMTAISLLVLSKVFSDILRVIK